MKFEAMRIDSDGAQISLNRHDARLLHLSYAPYRQSHEKDMNERGSVDWTGSITKAIDELEHKIKRINRVFDLDRADEKTTLEVWLPVGQLYLIMAAVKLFRNRNSPTLDVFNKPNLRDPHEIAEKYISQLGSITRQINDLRESTRLRETLKKRA